MGDGFQFLDIVFFAMIAAFLVLRLRNVLGRRTGNERRPETLSRRRESEDNVIELPDRGANGNADSDVKFGDDDDAAGESDAASAAITQLKIADPTFETDQFIEGARAAFEMVISAFAAGDREALRPLLNDEVYRNITSAIDAREQAKVSLETTLVGIDTANIIEARLEGRVAFLTVKFVSEQINVSRDSEDRVVDGDPNNVVRVTDLWTFARNTRSQDPNWTLVETRSPN